MDCIGIWREREENGLYLFGTKRAIVLRKRKINKHENRSSGLKMIKYEELAFELLVIVLVIGLRRKIIPIIEVKKKTGGMEERIK